MSAMPRFIQSPIDTLGRYFDYKGRATRFEFWTFILFTWVTSIGVGLIDVLIPGDYLGSIWNLFLFIPTITCAIRRMHDVDHRGWYLLIPIYNFIILLFPTRPPKETKDNTVGLG